MNDEFSSDDGTRGHNLMTLRSAVHDVAQRTRPLVILAISGATFERHGAWLEDHCYLVSQSGPDGTAVGLGSRKPSKNIGQGFIHFSRYS